MEDFPSYAFDQKKSPIRGFDPKRINFVAVLVFVVPTVLGIYLTVLTGIDWYFVGAVLVGWFSSLSPKVANQWEKGIILRFGKFHRQIGPGLYWILPLIDRAIYWIDQRVNTTPFRAEKTLTKDTVPVDVDAVLFWLVWDAKKAALEVQQYREAIFWAAQTALRDIIGKTELAELLADREKLDKKLQSVIDDRTEPWGITVQSVEIRDVIIPELLQDAMSRQAQAERERQARVILGEAEKQIAGSFAEASVMYQENPTAFHLRAMNMLYEGLKEKGALIVVPSTAVESMGLGAITGLAALNSAVTKKPLTQ